jgi:hypothetical protein
MALSAAQTFRFDQLSNSITDIVTYGSHFFQRTRFGVRQRPVTAAQAWDIRTLVTTPHRDEHLRSFGELCRKLLRLRIGQVNINLVHYVHHDRVDTVTGLSASGDAAGFRWVCNLIEKGGRHLGSPSIMDTGKDIGLQSFSSLRANARL